MTDNKQQGFTLTELMFAMLFITFLLIFGVTVIIQSMQIYNKGLSLRLMTQSGRQVTEDMARSMRYAGNVTVDMTKKRICTGQVTYAWNIGETDTTNVYTAGATPIRLVQVTDPGGTLCLSTGNINAANAKEIVSSNLAVQCFTPQVRESGRMIAINFVISTSGVGNRPNDVAATGANIDCDRDNNPSTPATGIECPAGGQGAFCALSEFNTSVYVRSS